MKLRLIDCPSDIRWLSPVMSPADLQAVASSRQIIAQAQARAARLMQEASASVAAVQAEARQQFLNQYGAEFRQALAAWQADRAAVQSQLTDYARQMAMLTLQRLGLELSASERLSAVLRQVLSETLPDAALLIKVAAEAEATARDALSDLLSRPDMAALAGLSCQVESDPALRDDEVVLIGPRGARIACSFRQLVNQLLLCL